MKNSIKIRKSITLLNKSEKFILSANFGTPEFQTQVKRLVKPKLERS